MNCFTVPNATVRAHIEAYTREYCYPYIVEFAQDGSGKWVVGLQVLDDLKYVATRKSIRQYIIDNGINLPAGVNTWKEILQNYGSVIQYTPNA